VSPPLPRLLSIETSDRVGQVAVAEGPTVLQVRALTETRRHARDLAPAVAELLATQGWQPRHVDAIVVSRGPGSYTGLRVGVMSAKTFAFATGCRLIAVDTFLALASQAPADVMRVDVLADAQQQMVYVQAFARSRETWAATAPLEVRAFADWLRNRSTAAHVTGPGLQKWGDELSADIGRLPPDLWHPSPVSLLHVGLARLAKAENDDPLSLEPLYLRASAAEQQWRDRSSRP
jgi:tRNA threonylcarbamoyladenosine biosynthesis protein TsaB